ncbi:uncharacterized protein [Hetaerina americana]|uniref:uncharacterized protein n=1 Tax=Hetaerina americana TaxID=62018 RepID=UPI003A7F51B6
MEAVIGNEQSKPKGFRYYILDSIMNAEEDRTHEFKGHRNIAIEEIPPWCIDANDKRRKTRNCISRNICGFLNSGLGGTVYVGVLDNGSIVGILLSRYQRDHLKLSLKDTLQRFRPPVPNHLVSVKFIPCVDRSDVKYNRVMRRFNNNKNNVSSDESAVENCNEKGILGASELGELSSANGYSDATITPGAENGMSTEGWDWAVENVDQTELPKLLKFKNDILRKRPHVLRTYRQCWCDDDAITRVTHGHKSPAYVVEIVVRPPSAKDPEIRKHLPHSSELLLQPIFQAEDGSIYIRRHASLARRSLQDMIDEAVEDVHRVYYPILKEAQIHLGILEALVEKVESLEIDSKDNSVTSEHEKSGRCLFQKLKQLLH